MLIELLKFKIAAEMRETCIQKDAEIWTTALAKYPGFLGKEVWINPHVGKHENSGKLYPKKIWRLLNKDLPQPWEILINWWSQQSTNKYP